ncbi:MAG: hypothetical protein JKY70_22175 [Mucilaginibacter sp.]|nr:hypothetical protein [Mucilaginibacter sp.]
MALYPFILLKEQRFKYDKAFINHERIHLRQQLELLILPFYLLYLLNYLFNLLRYKNHHKAYMNIAFEREAYRNEHNFNYLNTRKFCTFLSYF